MYCNRHRPRRHPLRSEGDILLQYGSVRGHGKERAPRCSPISHVTWRHRPPRWWLEGREESVMMTLLYCHLGQPRASGRGSEIYVYLPHSQNSGFHVHHFCMRTPHSRDRILFITR